MAGSNKGAANVDLFAVLTVVAVLVLGWVFNAVGGVVASVLAPLTFLLVFGSGFWFGPVRGFLVGFVASFLGGLLGGGGFSADMFLSSAVYGGFAGGMLPALTFEVMGARVNSVKGGDFLSAFVRFLLVLIAMFATGWVNTNFLHLGFPVDFLAPLVGFFVAVHFLFDGMDWGGFLGNLVVTAVAGLVFGFVAVLMSVFAGGDFMGALGAVGVSSFLSFWGASFLGLFGVGLFSGHLREAGFAR
jgi:hypothetical protein